jgi:hypothetical protein
VKTARPALIIAAVALSAKAAVIVPQVIAPQETAVPVVTVAKEDAPVAAAPSKWPPRSNSKS